MDSLTPHRSGPEPTWNEWFARVLHLDLWMLGLLMTLGVLGLFVVYSASGHSVDYLINQGERLLIGLAVMTLIAQVPPDIYRQLAPWVYGFTLLLLTLVPVLGDHAKGAVRWLDLGFVRFQPSELMKLAMPLTVAAFLHTRTLPPRFSTLLLVMVIIAVPSVLIMRQPDLGTSLLVIAAGLFALFFGGLGWRWIAAAAAAVAAAGPVAWSLMHDYQRRRILTFINPESDPLGAGYHITQSKIAIGSGGFFGKGWLDGTQATLDFLPESHTDFIFAVFAEEFGFVGVMVLLALYLTVVGRGLIIALRGQDTYQRLVAASLSLTFFLYAFINIGMVIGLMPVVGVPLPMMSYGGTSMVSLLAGFGMLMSIQTHRKLIGN